MRPIITRPTALATAVLLVASACGGATPSAERTASAIPAPSPTPAYGEATVRASEYSFDLRAELPAGLTILTFENAGQAGHNMALVRLKDGKTFDDLEAAIPKAPAGLAPVIEFAGGAVRARPGEQRKLIFDLTVGLYAVFSSAPAAGGPEFITKKMWKGFSVVQRSGDLPREPEAQVSIAMNDAATAGLPERVAPGGQIWKFGAEGTARRALVLARLEPNKTEADLAAWLKAQAGPAPATFVGGMLALSPGRRAWTYLDLAPGEYVAFDDAPGSPAGDKYLRFTVR